MGVKLNRGNMFWLAVAFALGTLGFKSQMFCVLAIVTFSVWYCTDDVKK